MNYSVGYKSVSKNQILIRSFNGFVKRADIMDSWEEIIVQEMILPSHVGVISDYTDAQVKIELEDLKSFISFFKRNETVFEGFKIAQVLEKQGVIFPIEFDDNHYDFKSKSFSTLEEAIRWISG